MLNVNVLEQNETPGLGTKMADEGNPLFASFEGRNPGEMKLAVKKDGGDVDALTAATISSRAYVDAIGARLCRLQADCGRGCSGRFRYGFGGYGDGRRCCGRGRFGCGCDRTNGR